MIAKLPRRSPADPYPGLADHGISQQSRGFAHERGVGEPELHNTTSSDEATATGSADAISSASSRSRGPLAGGLATVSINAEVSPNSLMN